MPNTYRNRNTGTLVNVLARATHYRTSVCLVVYQDASQTDAPTYADSPEGFEARFEPVPVEDPIREEADAAYARACARFAAEDGCDVSAGPEDAVERLHVRQVTP